MSKYVIWDKKSDIYTLGADDKTGKMHWTAEEYISSKAPWAANPNANVIVGGGSINGLIFLAYDVVLEQYMVNGMTVPSDATPQEVVILMEQFEKDQIAAQQAAAEAAAQAEAEYAAASLKVEQDKLSEMAFDNMMKHG